MCLCLAVPGISARESGSGFKTYPINDLALIYQGGTHRIDWNKDEFRPYVVHQFADGRKDWLFDGFLFLEITDGRGASIATRYTDRNADRSDWEWLLDRIFEQDKSLSALDQCIDEQAKEIGKPKFKHKIVLSIPEVMPEGSYWGQIDGETMDFSRRDHQVKATKWFVDQLYKRFKAARYKHLELDGFYWLAEDIDVTKDLAAAVSEYVRKDLKKSFVWIPYWQAHGHEQWRELGFDIAYQQPNHFFGKNIPDERLDQACATGLRHNMGMEMEFDEKALYDCPDSSYDRLVAYIDYFEKNGVFDKSAIAYYSGCHAVLDLANSSNPKDHEVLDRLAKLIIDRRAYMKNGKLKKRK